MKNVLIIGAGFAGVDIALRLADHPTKFSVTIISELPHLEYYPAVFRIMRGAPNEFCEVPLVDIFARTSNVTLVQGTATTIDPTTKTVTLANGTTYTGDYLVISVGSQATYFNIPGVEQSTLPLRRGSDVRALMAHSEAMFKSHATAPKEEQVVAFRFVVIGGGPSGVELASELADYTHKLAKKYSVHPSLITLDLIESRERVLGVLPEKASNFAKERLQSLGINLHFNRTLVKNESWTLELADSHLGARTVIWTAGVEVRDTSKNIPGFEYGAKNRIVVDVYMQAKGFLNVFVAGDIADTTYSGLAQTALAHAHVIAQNIIADNRGTKKVLYTPSPTAFAIPLGTGYALFGYGNWVITGYLPWLLRSVIDFHYLVSIAGFSWVWKKIILPTITKTRKI